MKPLYATALLTILPVVFAGKPLNTGEMFYKYNMAGQPPPLCVFDTTSNKWRLITHVSAHRSGTCAKQVSDICSKNGNEHKLPFCYDNGHNRLCHDYEASEGGGGKDAHHLLVAAQSREFNTEKGCFEAANRQIDILRLPAVKSPLPVQPVMSTMPRIFSHDMIPSITAKLNAVDYEEFAELLNVKEVFNRFPARFSKESFEPVFKFIVKKAKKITDPNFFPDGLIMLPRGFEGAVELTAEQVLCLHANMMLDSGIGRKRIDGYMNHSTYESLKTTGDNRKAVEFLAFDFTYYKTMYDISQQGPAKKAKEFKRKLIYSRQRAYGVNWATSNKPLVEIVGSKAFFEPIEEHNPEKTFFTADFANKLLGGGTLGKGYVQEETSFHVFPENMIASLIGQQLDDNESVLIVGSRKFSNYSKYGKNLEFTGPDAQDFNIKPSVAGEPLKRVVFAVDAVDFKGKEKEQLQIENINRDLLKMYAGVKRGNGNFDDAIILSGKWGCGAFQGYWQLKLIIQWLAISEAGRSQFYFGGADDDIMSVIPKLMAIRVIHGNDLTVGRVYKKLIRLVEDDPDNWFDLFIAWGQGDDLSA